jgi:hypothetical protein
MKLEYGYISDIDKLLKSGNFQVTSSIEQEINKSSRLFKLRDTKLNIEQDQISWELGDYE